MCHTSKFSKKTTYSLIFELKKSFFHKIKYMKKAGIISIIFVTIAIVGIYLFLCLSYIFYPIKYKDTILLYSEEYNIESNLIASLINAESSFNADAISNKGAIGLMQLMPQTAKWLAEQLDIEYTDEKLFDPEYNIRLGVYYLSYLSEKFRDTRTILCAYNAGEGVVRGWLKNSEYSSDGKTLDVIPYAETKAHVEKVEKGLKIYEKKLR